LVGWAVTLVLHEREWRPAGTDPPQSISTTSASHTLPSPGDILADLDDYIEHHRRRTLQDALNEATASYWRRRADTSRQPEASHSTTPTLVT
jgi:hypothetical protein